MASFSIPQIDISPMLNRDLAKFDDVISQWNASLAKFGFVIITGHGVSNEIIESLYSKSIHFFKLPLEEKMKFCVSKGYGRGGYVPSGIESVGRTKGKAASPPDLVESIAFSSDNLLNLRDTIPESFIPGITEAIETYFAELKKVMFTLLKLTTLAFKLPENFFEEFYQKPELALKLAYYPEIDSNLKIEQEQFRYAAHTDYLVLTILRTDDFKRTGHSLEIDFNGEWMPVVAPENAFVINVGDLLQRWTNGRWKSALHRVIPGEISCERLSLVYFTGPDKDTVIKPFCGENLDGETHEKYPPISVRDYLVEKLNQSNVENSI